MDLGRITVRVVSHEGFRDRVYDDATGKVLKAGDTLRGTATIGYGTTNLTESEARWLVQARLSRDWDRLRELRPWMADLPAVAQEVLVEMAYQMGIEGLLEFRRTLRYCEDRDWTGMSVSMLDSRWARQTPRRARELSGLIKGLEDA